MVLLHISAKMRFYLSLINKFAPKVKAKIHYIHTPHTRDTSFSTAELYIAICWLGPHILFIPIVHTESTDLSFFNTILWSQLHFHFPLFCMSKSKIGNIISYNNNTRFSYNHFYDFNNSIPSVIKVFVISLLRKFFLNLSRL